MSENRHYFRLLGERHGIFESDDLATMLSREVRGLALLSENQKNGRASILNVVIFNWNGPEPLMVSMSR